MGATKRSSNIELLRIYSMFFIAFGHLWQIELDEYPFVPMLLRSMFGIGKLDCFVFITGYFLIFKTEFSLNRWFKILFQIIFYNVVLTAIFAALGKAPWIDVLISANPLLPTKFNAWFTTQMLGLILIQPFLSRLVSHMTKRQYQGLLLVLYSLTLTLVMDFRGEVFIRRHGKCRGSLLFSLQAVTCVYTCPLIVDGKFWAALYF